MKIHIPILKIELDSDGIHILVKCKLHTEGYFIIDTGASKSVINSDIIEFLPYKAIPVETIESSELTGMVSGEIIEINSISFNNNDFTAFQALSMSLEHVNTIYERFIDKPIFGLIGGDFLQKNKAVINYDKNKITLDI